MNRANNLTRAALWATIAAALVVLVAPLIGCDRLTNPQPCPSVREEQGDSTYERGCVVTGVKGGIEGVAK